MSNDLEFRLGERMEKKRPGLCMDARNVDPRGEKSRIIPSLGCGEGRVGEQSSGT